MDIDIAGGIYNDPDYQQAVGQAQQLQDETERAILNLQSTPTSNLAFENTGHNVTLGLSGGKLFADVTGNVPSGQVTGLGTMATKNTAAAVADLSTTASATYVQAELQAVIDKLNALLGSLRTAVHIST